MTKATHYVNNMSLPIWNMHASVLHFAMLFKHSCILEGHHDVYMVAWGNIVRSIILSTGVGNLTLVGSLDCPPVSSPGLPAPLWPNPTAHREEEAQIEVIFFYSCPDSQAVGLQLQRNLHNSVGDARTLTTGLAGSNTGADSVSA